MALTGEEIRARLSVLAARWSVYDGSERSEAQTFLPTSTTPCFFLPAAKCSGLSG